MKNQISATIIADSKNTLGHRLTTFILVMPRMILSEFNTHRMISRNSASSRAIPFDKMVKAVEESPFIPIKWMKDHSGMQGTEYENSEEIIEYNTKHWLNARDKAVVQAKLLHESWNVTKQICNRLLEPFMYHTVIATASDWDNFFALRAQDAAEIHMQDLAYKMLEAYNSSNPRRIYPGEWHIPFCDKIIMDRMPIFEVEDKFKTGKSVGQLMDECRIKIATACCARVSYTLLGEMKEPDYKKDVELHDKLLQAGHMSPFEHCAKAMSKYEYYIPGTNFYAPSGNFNGFIQYRKTLAGENKTDNRIKK